MINRSRSPHRPPPRWNLRSTCLKSCRCSRAPRSTLGTRSTTPASPNTVSRSSKPSSTKLLEEQKQKRRGREMECPPSCGTPVNTFSSNLRRCLGGSLQRRDWRARKPHPRGTPRRHRDCSSRKVMARARGRARDPAWSCAPIESRPRGSSSVPSRFLGNGAVENATSSMRSFQRGSSRSRSSRCRVVRRMSRAR